MIDTEDSNAEDFWRRTPSFLDNNERNRALSSSKQDENNQITEIAQQSQYAKLLLRSDAILPILIADGTFQSSIYRSTMIIVMVISSNRTNIQIAWVGHAHKIPK